MINIMNVAKHSSNKREKQFFGWSFFVEAYHVFSCHMKSNSEVLKDSVAVEQQAVYFLFVQCKWQHRIN